MHVREIKVTRCSILDLSIGFQGQIFTTLSMDQPLRWKPLNLSPSRYVKHLGDWGGTVCWMLVKHKGWRFTKPCVFFFGVMEPGYILLKAPPKKVLVEQKKKNVAKFDGFS